MIVRSALRRSLILLLPSVLLLIPACSGGLPSFFSRAQTPITVLASTSIYPFPFFSNVSWSPDGQRLAAHEPGIGIHIWNRLHTEEVPMLLLDEQRNIDHFAWSPDGSTIVADAPNKNTSDESGATTIRLWDTMSGELIAESNGPEGEVEAFYWPPDSPLLAAVSQGDSVYIWNVDERKEITRLTTRGDVSGLAEWSPDGRLLAITSNRWEPAESSNREVVMDYIEVWHVERGTSVFSVRLSTTGIGALAWSPDSQQLAVLWNPRGSDSSDKRLQRWNVESGEAEVLFDETKHRDALATESVSWSPDGRYIALCDNSQLRILDAGNGQQVRRLRGTDRYPKFLDLAWSPNGGQIAAVSNDKLEAYIWANPIE